MGGGNLYEFNYNSPLNWVDRLGFEPLPPRPSTLDGLVARSTEKERKEAYRKALRGTGSATDYQNILWEMISERENRTGEVLVQKAESQCDCGKAFIRIGVGSGASETDHALNNLNPWLELSGDARKATTVNRNKYHWDFRIERGPRTCQILNVHVRRSASPDEDRWLEENPGARRPVFEDLPHNFEWDDKASFETIAGSNAADHLSPFYPRPYETHEGKWETTWVRIVVTGKKSSENANCCEVKYYVH
jgi:hypothetical protein